MICAEEMVVDSSALVLFLFNGNACFPIYG